jgi:hexosaminidase
MKSTRHTMVIDLGYYQNMIRQLAFTALLAGALPAQAPTHTLMPAPASVQLSQARFRIDSSVSVSIVGMRDDRLERGVDRAIRRLEARVGHTLPREYGNRANADIVVSASGPGHSVPDLGEDESYRLLVEREKVTLSANTVVGVLRGLETLLQLHSNDAQGGYLQGGLINDSPRFPWRGLLVDVARHWQPPEVIKRTLDGMATAKLNVLHWHLTEDQGFRVESKLFPALHQQGSDGLYYTQEEIRGIVEYATDRGIRVVPEFDMPGHTTAWFVGHPELATAPGPYLIERRWGVHRPTMDPTRETTYQFLDAFVGEMVELFPDRFWHIGGDEVHPEQWNESEAIQAWMREHDIADAHALQTHFNERLFGILTQHGRQPVGWDEILQPGLPDAAVIQSWRGTDGLVQATAQGRQAILSAPYYLDHIKTAEQMYLADPLPSGLSAAQAALVLGGEACMWGEYITLETIDSRLWPRMLAVAERFWSPASVRDVPDMYRRMAAVSRQLGEVGPTHLTHAEQMLNRIFPSDDVPAVREFLKYARPRGFAGRGTNQLSPLTRLIDAADPDPLTEQRLLMLAERVREPAWLGELDKHFLRMMSFDTMFSNMLPRAPMAADAAPLAAALLRVGAVGHDALQHIAAGTTPNEAWMNAANATIEETRGKTFGLLRPVGVESVKLLVARLAP